MPDPSHHARPRSSAIGLYFAYGSNIAVDQMAKRCPSSTFVGLARLAGYRWQINQRGVANIVKVGETSREGGHSEPYVEGLVYQVTPTDVQSLDRSEGVRQQLYQRYRMPVSIQELRGFSGRLSSELGPALAEQALHSNADAQLSEHGHANPQPYMRRALVYISDNYNEDGPIRHEYIQRMRTAVKYGVALGMSQAYVDDAIGPHLVADDAEDSSSNSDTVADAGDVDEMELDPPREPRTTKAKTPLAQKMSRQAVVAECGDPECRHGTPLCELREENRKPHRVSGARFHDAIFAQLMLAQESSSANNADDKKLARPRVRRDTKFVYSVIVEEPTIVLPDAVSDDATSTLPASMPRYSVENAATTRAVAAELALRHFRDSLARFQVPAGDNGIIGAPVPDTSVSGTSSAGTDGIHSIHWASSRPGQCVCRIDKDTVHFSVHLPEHRGGGFIKVWVLENELLTWE